MIKLVDWVGVINSTNESSILMFWRVMDFGPLSLIDGIGVMNFYISIDLFARSYEKTWLGAKVY